VLTLADGRPYACGDHAGSPVLGPDEAVARPLGLNLPPVAEALRRHAFPRLPSGAAHLRWPAGVPAPSSSPFGVLALLRQTIQTRAAAWVEHGTALWLYLLAGDGEPILVQGEPKGQLLRGLFASTIRLKPATPGDLIDRLRHHEVEIAQALRPPDDRERDLGLRHAVCPLFAAVVEV
jgi:hypothetical protein